MITLKFFSLFSNICVLFVNIEYWLFIVFIAFNCCFIVSFDVMRSMRQTCNTSDHKIFNNSNCFVDLTGAVNKYVNSNTYIFVFYDFLCLTVDL